MKDYISAFSNHLEDALSIGENTIFSPVNKKIKSAYLTIPKTIHFLESYKWNEVTQSCKDLNLWARNEICKELDLQPISNEKFNGQMTSFLFPLKDVLEDQQRFYSKYNIQIPFFKWYNTTLFRISIQAYNNKEDVDKLIYALKDFSK